jgi:hypothetical protein
MYNCDIIFSSSEVVRKNYVNILMCEDNFLPLTKIKAHTKMESLPSAEFYHEPASKLIAKSNFEYLLYCEPAFCCELSS